MKKISPVSVFSMLIMLVPVITRAQIDGYSFAGAKDTLFVQYENLGKELNSPYPDFSAVLNKNEDLLVFTSRRKGNTGSFIPADDIYEYEDIYFSQKDENGNWTKAKRLKGDVNSNNHEAPVWLSEDGKHMLIYKPTHKGDIYETELKGKEWTKPKPVTAINSGERETHASITADGKTIYFTSTSKRYGNEGGLDIFMIRYNEQKRKWSEPENLGDLINTPYNEECVTISGDGNIMYFSSEGHNSIGGYDIFISYNENGKWTAPVNLGYPINSPSNDIYISLTADGKHAYIDSDRPGGIGEKDIYKVTFLNNYTIPATFRIMDTHKKPVNGTVTITDIGNRESATITSDENGQFNAALKSFRHYMLSFVSENNEAAYYTFDTKAENLDSFTINSTLVMKNEYTYRNPSNTGFTLTEINDLDEAPLDEHISLFYNIYFEFGYAELTGEVFEQLDMIRKLMLNDPSLKLKLSGHTDAVSSSTANMLLSRKRVNAVAEWMINAGISEDRIIRYWYGEELPAAPNQSENGTDDPIGRRFNRRVEVLLLKP